MYKAQEAPTRQSLLGRPADWCLVSGSTAHTLNPKMYWSSPASPKVTVITHIMIIALRV